MRNKLDEYVKCLEQDLEHDNPSILFSCYDDKHDLLSVVSTIYDDLIQVIPRWSGGFPGGSEGKASAYSVGDPGLIPGLGRSPGEGNSNPLQDYCLENPMDREAWQATAHGVTKSRTRLNDFTFSLSTVQYSKQSLLPLDHENLILLNFVNFSAPWQYPNLFVLDMLNLFLGTE